MIVVSFVSASVIIIPFINGSQVFVVATLAAVFLVQGFGIGVGNVHWVSVRQAITRPELLARMNASYRTMSYGAIPIGAFLGGALGQWVGLRPALLIGGIGLLLAPLIVVLSPLRHVRELPAPRAPKVGTN
jgi:predicted MFS family arabinose efflux permease